MRFLNTKQTIMKRLFTTLFTCSAFIFATGQTFVSTTPENKNIILEEYTGISCGYCPDGHKIGQQLHDQNPNDVFLINIHTGGYANPQGPGTDFNTSFGSALAGQTGLTGYPSGTVNRHVFSGGNTALSRSVWGSNASQLMSQPSPVNVGIQASIDMATNTLTVDVEVYYTGSQTVTSNKLNIAVVQNGILGPQSGGASYNPTAIDPATGLYTHNHMLRHLLTGQWGEPITNISQGTLYSNSYTWVMPNQISGFAQSPNLDPTNIAIVAFVSEGNQEILSGTEVYPDLIFQNSFDANLISASATDIMCNTHTDLSVDIKNYGNTNLYTLDVEYSINGGSTNTYPWYGNLSPGASANITIPGIYVMAAATNIIDVNLTNPNGQFDQNINNNTSQATFNGMITSPPGTGTIEIMTDGYASETTWKLYENGSLILTGGPYSTNNTMQTPATFTINTGSCYKFVMEDSYGDGLLQPGYYKVINPNSSNIVWGGSAAGAGGIGNFTSEQTTYFESSFISTPSWNCDGGGNCYVPATGIGQYSTINACQAACVAPPASFDCDGAGNCYDPGTGQGLYSSISACQSSCVAPSWDCDGQGNCFDPGTGNGQYSSASECQAACISTSIDDKINSLLIYPNPVKDKLYIEGIYEYIEIVDLSGKILIYSEMKESIDISNLTDGLYFIQVTNRDSKSTHKITVIK